jgi:hypothetical protein
MEKCTLRDFVAMWVACKSSAVSDLSNIGFDQNKNRINVAN